MPAATPETRVTVPSMRAAWLRMTFVHWPMEPSAVQQLLPAGLTVDEFDGKAWVSLTPFVMADIRLLGRPRVLGLGPCPLLPDVPRLPDTLETNLRTYVRGPDGRDGLWFLSLDTPNAALVVSARALLGAPYYWASLDLRSHDDTITYTGRCRGDQTYQLTVHAGAPTTPTALDVWLTGRWRAYTCRSGVLLSTPVQHEPWPLREATVEVLEEALTEMSGLPSPEGPPLVHCSDGVRDVRMGLPRPVGRCG